VSPFAYHGGSLYCEDVRLDQLASQAGTPCYVYAGSAITERFRAYDDAFGAQPHLVCYAVKANSNLAVLKLLADAGAGFDIVSGGELFRVIRAGGDPEKVVFSGAGKRDDEIRYALEEKIHSFNCESEQELERISAAAASLGVTPRVALRVNPDVDAATHPYISTGLREHKFGISITEVEEVYEAARRLPHLDVEGVSCHIGSQLLDIAPVMEAVDRMLGLVARLRQRGFQIRTLDLGGGLGVAYRKDDEAPAIGEFVRAVCAKTAGIDVTLMMEPGRSIVGEAGALLTRVLYRKRNGNKNFVIVDSAMNDLIRPTLYQAHHEILPLSNGQAPSITADVVGPVCETGDFFARDRKIPDVQPGDLLALTTAGAYGFAQASNYNARTRAAEVLVTGNQWRIVRGRENYEDLIRGEIA
jgi:diaminopimelate decarboxylase